MGSSVSIKRRDFLVGVGLGSVGLAFGFHVDALSAVGPSANAPGLKMAWVHIAPDDKITIMAPVDEMGQGSSTALAVIFAEELDADWNKVSVEFSPPDDKLYGNPTWWTYGIMLTGASTAMSGFYQALRLYGAQARRVLRCE